MYTAELSQFTFAAARKAATGPVKKALDRLHRAWITLNKEQSGAYTAQEDVPGALRGSVQRAVAAISDAFADAALPLGDPLLTFYWEALQFMALAEQMGGHALFDVSLAPRPSGGGKGAASTFSTLCIRNVVPAPHLAARHAAAHATVLFSGTLNPSRYHCDMLGLPETTAWLNIEGPFRAEQLRVQVADHISTRYRDRERSLGPIVDVVAAQYQAEPGN